MLDVKFVLFWKPNKILKAVPQLLHSDRGYFGQLVSGYS